MLQAIRERAQGLVAWVIIIFITVPFALWGIQSYLGGGSEQSVAVVGGTEITQAELDNFYYFYRQQQLQRLQGALGGALSAAQLDELLDEDRMKKEALDAMIRDRTLLDNAFRAGYTIGDGELARRIQTNPAFHRDGKFDEELYELQLRNQGLSSRGYENRLLTDLVMQQIYDGVLVSAGVTAGEVDAAIRVRNQKREIAYAIVPARRFAADVQVTDAEISEFYEANPRRFTSPERVVIEYLELSAQEIAGQVEVSEEDLRGYFEDRSGDFARADTGAALTRANEVLERIRAGEAFDDLAREYSADPGSRDTGGDLGYFGRADMDQAFTDAAYAMQVGEVSAPVQTEFGYHIIKLTDIRGDERRASHILFEVDEGKVTVPAFEDIRDQVETAYRRWQAEERFIEELETLANLAYEIPDSLDEAANRLTLEVRQSKAFSRDGGEGIAANQRVVNAAFSEDVLVEGNNSDVLELTDDRAVALRIKERMPEAMRPLEEVRDEIVDQLTTDKARAAAETLGRELIQALAAGEAPQTLAEKHQLEWHDRQLVDRRTQEVSPEVLARAFSIARPSPDAASFDGTGLASADYAVIGVYQVQDGDPAAVGDAQRAAIRDELVRATGQEYLADMLAAVRSAAKVEVFLKK